MLHTVHNVAKVTQEKGRKQQTPVPGYPTYLFILDQRSICDYLLLAWLLSSMKTLSNTTAGTGS